MDGYTNERSEHEKQATLDNLGPRPGGTPARTAGSITGYLPARANRAAMVRGQLI